MKLLLSFVLIVVLLLGGAVIAPSFVDWNSYKDQVTQKVAVLTGLDVDVVGDVSLAILPSPRIYLEDVRVADPSEKGTVLASFKMLDIRVGLSALFRGELDVTAVRLEQPVVRLVRDAQGRFNYMTPQIEAMQALSGSSAGASKPSEIAVSFDVVEVSGGAFSYKAPDQHVEVSGVDFDVQADSLRGPFKGHGAFVYDGKKVTAEIKAGVLDMDSMSASLNLKAVIDGMNVGFSGVVTGGEEAAAQGEFSLAVPSFGRVIKNDAVHGDLSLRGVLSANAKALALKDAEITLGKYGAGGQVQLGLGPIDVKGAFVARDAFDLSAILGAKPNSGAVSSPLSFTNALPQTLELPKIKAMDVSLALPAVLYNGQRFGDVAASISKTAKGFDLTLRLPEVPGEGALHIDAGLNFAEKSYSGKTKLDIYSDPQIDVKIKGQAQNIPVMVEAISGAKDLPLVASSKNGVFEFDALLNAKGAFLNKGVVNLDKDAYAITGSLQAQGGSDSDLLKVKVVADSVDVEKVMGGSSEAKTGQGNAVKLPFDVAVDAQVQKLLMQGQAITGLRVGASFKDQKLSVHKFAADDFAGHKVTVDGVVSVDVSGAKPYLKGDVDLGDLVWMTSKTKAQKSSGAKWSSEPIANDWLESMNMDMAVRADSILYEGWNLSKPSLDVGLKDGKLDLRSLKAGLYDGVINATGGLSAPASGGLSINGKASIDGVNMEPLVKSLAGTNLVKGRGEVSLSTDVSGSGRSMKALVSALKGQGSVTGQDIVLDGIDVSRFARALSEDAKPGDTLLNLWKGTTNGGSTSFETLDGVYVIENGVVDLQKLFLDGPRASINTTGKINLPLWTVQTAHLMSVKDRDDVPPFTVNISGSLDNPGQTFAQGALNDYLSRKIQRKLGKVLSDKLGGDLGGASGLDGVLQGVIGGALNQGNKANDNSAPQDDQSEPKAVTPEDVVEDLLRGFLR